MDEVLHAERLDGKAKRLHRMPFSELPDGTFVSIDGEPYVVRGKRLLRWTPKRYDRKIGRPRGTADVLTPPSMLRVLARGYQPRWHPSAD
jgi:hypothetical protein